MTRRVVLCVPERASGIDPDPDETARRDVELAYEWDGRAAGLVGWAEGGWTAVNLAQRHGDLVDRLVLASTPVPTERIDPAPVAAKVLLYGARDGGSSRARWWQKAIGGRIEMLPGEGRDILERVWARALSHVAPRTLQR